TPDQLQVWRKATKVFMRRNPDVKVRFENLPYAQYWDNFQTMMAAKTLTFGFDEDGRIDQYGTLIGDWSHFVWQNGGDLVDDPLRPTSSTMNTPEVVEALQWLVDLRFKHHVTTQPGELADMGGYEMFMTGKVAMVFGGHWDVPTFSKIRRFRSAK
nr:extracellular solute-binding protein [Anaerolineae bacterium]NIN97571.1 extracellular solute-binding protein [Anaerolineae bacterium]NIQ80500.1 extracellular solute-binding protein [Anaerolineae bacterium]